MEKVGIIAGVGNLPLAFCSAAMEQGYDVYPVGLFDEVNETLKKHPNYVQMNIGEIGKLLGYILINKIDKLIMLGKVEKSLIYKNLQLDETFQALVSKLPDRKDETLVFGVISLLKENGIEILPQDFLLSGLLCEKKVYTKIAPNKEDNKTIEIGVEAAKALATIDVGQTVVLKNRAVVALEAVEGTDETIKRAGKYAGEGCIIVKMSRPQQDMRVDVPVVGLNTLEEAMSIKAKGIVFEAKRMIILDKEELIKKANENNMFILGV